MASLFTAFKVAEEKLKLEKDPVIIITDTVFPGTEIFIKRRKKRIDKKMQNAKFYEDPEQKVIRMTSAV